MTNMDDPRIKHLLQFAVDNSVALVLDGEVGFGRPCVGFTCGGNYLDINPRCLPDYHYAFASADERLYPPEEVPNAYHKHDCFCVLIRDGDREKAITELDTWLTHLQSFGKLVIEDYVTGAEGLQAVFSGIIGHALRIKAIET